MKGTTKLKLLPAPDLTGHIDLSLHQLHDTLGDGQTQAGTAIFARGGNISLLERHEQIADLLSSERPMPVSITLKRKEMVPSSSFCFSISITTLAFFGKLDRVVGQVAQYLFETDGIPPPAAPGYSRFTLTINSMPF